MEFSVAGLVVEIAQHQNATTAADFADLARLHFHIRDSPDSTARTS
jgi:hypothetical protein